MPIVELHILEGYNSDEKQRLGTALTEAVRFVVPADPDLVTVMIHDMPAEAYYRGGHTRQPAPARPEPVQLVKDYLAAMEARDLRRAQTMLGEGFSMVFPGTAPMTDLDALMDWSRPRYRSISKAYDGFDAMQGKDEAAIVYCRGTLQGEYLDGTRFDGIRFIDRFEIVDGQILRQDVWNDMAEVRSNI